MFQEKPLSSFAVIGAGTLGIPIVKALAECTPQPHIVVLTRHTDKGDFMPPAVEIAPIDYDDQRAVVKTLKDHDVEVVISTTSSQTVHTQYKFVDAAKEAGVKLFAPSEFGLPSEGGKEDMFLEKDKVQKYLESKKLPYVRFYTGGFIEYVPFLFGMQTGKVNLIGQSNNPGSFVAIEDTAAFIAHVLTNFPLSKLKNATFRIEGQRIGLQDLAQYFKNPIKYVDKVPGNNPEESNFRTMLQKYIESGKGTVNWDWTKGHELSSEEIQGENAQQLFKNHVWKQIGQVSFIDPAEP